MRTTTLDVLIVAYKNPDLLRTCLDGVANHLRQSRIAVWDNSGPDFEGIRDVAADYPHVDWFLGSANLGFAAAVNRLAATCSGDFLLLNPDAELLGNLAVTRSLLATPGVAAVAPRCIDPTAGLDYRDWDVAHREVGLIGRWVDKAWYAPRLRGRAWSSLYAAPPSEVDGYLTGACLAISAAAWAQIGDFDEEFFLYGEEEQWQRRARGGGYRLLLADEVGVRHTGHGTVADDSVAARRSTDLLQANIALNIEQTQGKRVADVYIAGCGILDRIQRSARAERARLRATLATDRPAVIITTNRFGYGGAERQHVLLAGELYRRGYAVTIVCIQRFGPLIGEVPAGVRVVRRPWWAPMVDGGNAGAVVISGDTNTETGFATLWRLRSKDRSWLIGAHSAPSATRPRYSLGLRTAMRRADGFVALSPQHWTQICARQKVNDRHFIAPNGVMTEQELAHREFATRDAPGRPRNGEQAPLRLVMLARIVEKKNPHLLVEALNGLREYDWELDIFGDGPDRERLQRLTPPDLADRIRWRGWSPGPDHAFADADLVCLPSEEEAFPLVIVEAMSRRLPVIATDVCSVGDILDHGKAGIVVSEPTVAAWRHSLVEAFSSREALSALGDRGYDRAFEQYTIDAMADAYEAAIGAVDAGGRNAGGRNAGGHIAGGHNAADGDGA